MYDIQFLLRGWTIPVRVRSFAFLFCYNFKEKLHLHKAVLFSSVCIIKEKIPKLFLFTVEIIHSIIVNNAANTYYTFWQNLSFIKVVTCLKAPIFVCSVLVMYQTKFPNVLNFFFSWSPFFLTWKIGLYLFYISFVVTFSF